MVIKIGKNKSAVLYYLFSSVFVKAVLFIITPLISRALTPHEFGLYALYTAYLSITSVLLTLEMSGVGIYRELSKKDETAGFLSSLLLLQLALTVFAFLIFIPFQRAFSDYTGLSSLALSFVILQSALSSVEGIYLAKCRYELQYRRAAIINLLSGTLGALLSLLLIMRFNLSYEGRIIGQALISLIFAIPMAVGIFSRGAHLDISAVKYLIFTLLPLLPHYLSRSLTVQVGKIVVSKLLTESELGAYGAAMSVSLAVSLVSAAMSNAVLPWINRSLLQDGFYRITKTLFRSVFLLLSLCLIFILLVPILFRALYPSEYYGGIFAVYPLCLSVIFVFISGAYNQLILRDRGSFTVSLISIFGSLLCTLLSVVLARRLSLFGVGLALLISEASTTLIKGALLSKRIKFCAFLPAGVSVVSLCFFAPVMLQISNIF